MKKLAGTSTKLLASLFCIAFGQAQTLPFAPPVSAQGQPEVPAPAGTIKPPNALVLGSITKRGKDLYEYDKACSQATDALLAQVKNAASFKLFVAYPEHDIWHVAFGTMGDDGESFLVAYEVTLKPDKPADVKSYDIFKLDKAEFFRRAKALSACQSKLKSTGPLMNYAAIPNQDDKNTYWVYQFPGTTEPGVFLLGGDVRYLVSNSDHKILQTRQMHRSVLSWPKRGDLPNDAHLQGGCHSAILDDEPEDTDVFHVLLRQPQLPEYIATANWIFCVETDGTIRLVKTMKETSQQ
ncbi:MAG: hypothetical protein QG574_686 [Cyanobacteriota bacterium erpe_2018_sw_21hr_WHONDRS-SW48-000092_B_bin.40]|nr:hypothetical protein [Cyanobacteriota bacterium erpe_2018_sw_21hr_WHONDRS-SW48-000092_B_bin.40]